MIKLSNYTLDEEQFLRENYKEYTTKELAFLLDRTLDGIAQKLKEMRLLRGEKIKPYTEEEINFIQENAGKLTQAEIAKRLGRTQAGVSKFMTKHRIIDERRKRKTISVVIEKCLPPFLAKGDDYFEILKQLDVGDSFLYSDSDKTIVNNKKTILIKEHAKSGKEVMFSSKFIGEINGVQMRRMWRIK